MKIIKRFYAHISFLTLLILALIGVYYSTPITSGYTLAFEADIIFKSDSAKFTYLSNKYKISSLYYITNDCK